jgi:hypothetical protein
MDFIRASYSPNPREAVELLTKAVLKGLMGIREAEDTDLLVNNSSISGSSNSSSSSSANARKNWIPMYPKMK